MPLPEDDSEKGYLWDSLGTGLETLICTVERMADPDAQVTAIVRASAADYINFFRQGSYLEKKELHDTSVLLEITFPEYVNLSHVLDICYRISCHPKACDFTLQQFNSKFFCSNIILGLLRPQAKWDVALSEQYEAIMCQAVDDWLQQLVATESSTNLALVVSSTTITTPDSSSNPSLSLSQTISECFRSQDSLCDFQQGVRSALWTSEQEGALRGVISQILNKVTDRTTSLVSNGTGESSIEDLFRRDPIIHPLDVPQDWQEDIQREDHHSFKTLINSAMWPVHEATLKGREKAVSRGQVRSKLSTVQRPRYLEPVLKARLLGLRCKAAWRRASASTADDQTPLRILNTVLRMPRQIHNISKVSGPSVLNVAAELEQRATDNNPMKIEGDGPHRLQLVVDMNADYSGLEPQVVSQIEQSIRNMVQNHPGYDSDTLRMATLQLLMCLRKRGENIKLHHDPKLTWRLCLWYSLGSGITKSLAEVVENRCASSEPKYECRQLMTVSANKFLVLRHCQLSYSQIQTFILGRMKPVGEVFKKDKLGSLELWKKEIKTVMSTIWNDKRTWKDALVNGTADEYE
ncbi:hypothetical protein FRC09_000034 [Ceratobasidium sp. 395]|nr:hypothetical protein FRC09_000034 [Ceratobasidium sp. 395]